MQLAIPDESEEAEIQEKRQTFIVSKLIDKIEDEESVPVAEYAAWKNKARVADDELNMELPDFPLKSYPRGPGGLSYNPMV
jgi:adenine-specific DNA methylase